MAPPVRFPSSAPLTHKVCNFCEQDKPFEEFPVAPLGRNGRGSRCLECAREKYHEAYKPHWQDKIRQTKYGMEAGQYDQMLADQRNSCAACSGPLSRDRYTHIDHDHETGAVRALLCHNCNMAVGHVRENPEIALAVAEYILSFRNVLPDLR